MKTRCPSCQTSFRITPEQLKARVGKVRCGQCQTVFNALDSLLDETITPAPSAPRPVPVQPLRPPAPPPAASAVQTVQTPDQPFAVPSTQPAAAVVPDDAETPADQAPADTDLPPDEMQELSEAEARELGHATGLIMPRETSAIPGYSKWVEGLMTTGPLSHSAEKATRWPFVLAALLLVLALVGQVAFRFRSEIAVTAPSLRPLLEVLCRALDADIPLPRHVELVSIETSDLQTDPARGSLLVLNATLRNRAGYGQAFPSLELSLTDTQDAAVARRVFAPSEYLSPPSDRPFPANSDVPVRLWIEVTGISAAGYRLYVFYP